MRGRGGLVPALAVTAALSGCKSLQPKGGVYQGATYTCRNETEVLETMRSEIIKALSSDQ